MTELAPMPDLVREVLMTMARESPEREICGFIMKDWAIRIVENDADEGKNFNMEHKSLLQVYRNEYDNILGIYHSHWNGREEPSDKDIAIAPPQWRYWIVTFDSVTEWSIANGECKPAS